MLLYEESYDQADKHLRLAPLAVLFLGFVAWKIFLPFWAITLILIMVVGLVMGYLLRSGSVRVLRNEVIVNAGHGFAANTTNIPVEDIGLTYIAERRGGFVYSLTSHAPESASRAMTIPACLPTYLFLKRGVVIERKSLSNWKLFIPSAEPERLHKALEDSQQMLRL